jgi:hypothetical protein
VAEDAEVNWLFRAGMFEGDESELVGQSLWVLGAGWELGRQSPEPMEISTLWNEPS